MLEQILPQPLLDLMRQMIGRPVQHHFPDNDTQQLYWRVRYTLGLEYEQLVMLLNDRSLPPHFRYRKFTIPKKDGSQRIIEEPGAELKRIQRAILTSYLRYHYPHPAALGFRAGKSIADHARAHAGAGVIITADIEDFFPSTTAERVYRWWEETYYPPADARLYTRLTTHLGGLPQGAPTSPALSNLVNVEMDSRLESRARASGGTYTRYADDMVFSWPEGLRPPADFELAVKSILREYGYRLHPRKGWQVWYRRDEPQITGLILTRQGGVDIPESMKQIMQELRRRQDEGSRRRLSGYEGYVKMVLSSPPGRHSFSLQDTGLSFDLEDADFSFDLEDDDFPFDLEDDELYF